MTSEALRKYQEFSSLPVSGHFDTVTREQMMRPRCGLPDLQDGVAFSTRCRWDHTNLTYAFDTGTKDITGGAEWNAIRAAFGTWQSLGSVTFREVSTTQNPEIQAGWRPANDPDLNMSGRTLAHSDFPPGCGVVTNTLPKPVHFNDTNWTWCIGAVLGDYDIETVALHEIGHIVGLQHSSVLSAVMYAYTNSNTTVRVLTQDDIDGFRSLYGQPPEPRPRPRQSVPSWLSSLLLEED